MPRRAVIVILAILLFGLIVVLSGHQPGMADLRVQAGHLLAWQKSHPFVFAALYFLTYVAVTALSLPFAVPMTLIGGAAFGLVAGSLLVSLGASVGALCAFLVSRYVFRDSLMARFGHRLDAINSGMERDGARYLFTLRLVPIFPFVLINLLMGLTKVPAFTFFWVSFLGMLPATIVYVNAGTQLATIRDLSGILSPGIVLSFLAIGALPWLARLIGRFFSGDAVPVHMPKPKQFDRNLVVIGAGAAGLTAAAVAAGSGARVSLIEAGRMGGDCLNTGCVPSKALIRAAHAARSIGDGARFGIYARTEQIDFPAVMAHVRNAIDTIAPHDSAERFTGLGVDVVAGRALLIDPWTVEVARHDGMTSRLTTRAIVLATGAKPVVPDLPGMADSGFVTSDTIWDHLSGLDTVPARMVVLGGGPIGCELAQAMARLGSRVTIVQSAGRLLPREDEDASRIIQAALVADGVTVLTGSRAIAVENTEAGESLVVDQGGSRQAVGFDLLLVAVGRKPDFTGLGLQAIGLSDHAIDETLATRFPHILVAGDAAGGLQLTSLAGHHGWHAAINGLFGSLKRVKVNDNVLPRTVYTEPEVAQTGLTAADAVGRGLPVDIRTFDLARLDRAVTDGVGEGVLKVVLAKGSDRILGVTLVGPHAGDLIAPWALAMRNKLGLSAIQNTLMAYPTLSEAGKLLAGEWRKEKLSPRLIGLLRFIHDKRRG